MAYERLKRLESHIRSLEAFRRRYTRETIMKDEHIQWGLRVYCPSSAEWQTYLEGLIEKHRRKYKPRPMLEQLRSPR